MNPDVVGVNEIENDGYGPDQRIAHLVDKLNAATGRRHLRLRRRRCRDRPGRRARHRRDQGRQLYKPAAVTPVGTTAVLNTVEFVNGGDGAPRSRPSLAQAFEVNATGGVFIADVNHLKTKGSACDVPGRR